MNYTNVLNVKGGVDGGGANICVCVKLLSMCCPGGGPNGGNTPPSATGVLDGVRPRGFVPRRLLLALASG